MNTPEHNLLTQSTQQQAIIQAVDRFYFVNEEVQPVRETGRKVFFEYLRTCPDLTKDDIEILHSVVDLVAELIRIREAESRPAEQALA